MPNMFGGKHMLDEYITARGGKQLTRRERKAFVSQLPHTRAVKQAALLRERGGKQISQRESKQFRRFQP